MERPRAKTTSRQMLHNSTKTLAACAADPEVAGLEQGLRTAHVGLKACIRAVEDQAEEVEAKLTLFELRDRASDRVVRRLELALLGAVDKRRSHPLYQRYFKDGVTAVTEAEARTVEPALVKEMLAALQADAAKPIIGPLATQFGPLLEAALSDVGASLAVLTHAEADHRFQSDKELGAARTTWEEEYVKLHAALTAALPHDRERVESYFFPFRKPPRKGADDAPDEEAPPAGAGTPPAATTTSPAAPPPAVPGGTP